MSKSIDFINYEGLQIKYEGDELIVVPLKVTRSNLGDNGKTKLQVYWKLGKKTERVPSYVVQWENKGNSIEVVYDQDENKAINDFAKTKKIGIEYGKEIYQIEKGNITQIQWFASSDNGNVTYTSSKSQKKLTFRNDYKEKRKTRTVEQIIRDQAAFRQSLLDIDPKCSISKITIPEVLQAAHILAVKDGGYEYINNGILLRSDLHLLFDSKEKILKIDNNGIVHIDSQKIANNPEYMKYDGAQLDNATLERIRENLEKANEL